MAVSNIYQAFLSNMTNNLGISPPKLLWYVLDIGLSHLETVLLVYNVFYVVFRCFFVFCFWKSEQDTSFQFL